jgi:hypothetical protein
VEEATLKMFSKTGKREAIKVQKEERKTRSLVRNSGNYAVKEAKENLVLSIDF